MSQMLVAYATKNGATAEIAEAIADQLRQDGHAVDCTPAGEVDSVEPYNAIVVGSAVYMKRWRPEARHFLKHNAEALARRPLWVFSSGPCGEKPDPSWSEPPKIIKLAERLGVRDHTVFGGRLPLEPGNFMERAMVRNCPPENRDLRDWDMIRTWAARIGRDLGSEASDAVARSAP
jgi:menaquinone-dependent protoporphyrinogen oxidase